MSKRTFRTALAVVVLTLVVASGVVVYFVREALSYPDVAHKGEGLEVAIEVESGMSFQQIAERLAEKDVVDRPTWFRLYALHKGVANRVRVGKYVLRDDMTPRQVLQVLVEGTVEKQVEVTLAEGKHMLEYFEKLEKAGVAKAAELEKLARDPDFLRKQGIPGDTAEGYLFPETYLFVVPTTAEKVLERLIAQHKEVWNSIIVTDPKAYEKTKKDLQWDDREILIMASIVEKEAQLAHERPTIAQVFINRLTDDDFEARPDAPKLLQTDPTIRYGCQVPLQKSAACLAWDKSDSLGDAQLQDKDNPYNTYQHEGLPPGPICNPGKNAIEAVLHPDGSRFFYFVVKEKGSKEHVFARSRREHEENVKKYVRSLKYKAPSQ
jgi:UPF0755 protein